jgi:hypothetical protein
MKHAVKSYDVGNPASFPLRRNFYGGFLSPLKIHRLGRVSTRENWIQCQDANHYTTEAT